LRSPGRRHNQVVVYRSRSSISPVRRRIQGPEGRVLRHLEAERVAKKRHHFLTSDLMHLHGGAPRNRVRQVPEGMSRVVDYALRREVEYERTPRVRTRKPVSYLEVDRVDGIGHEGVEVLPAPGDVTLQHSDRAL